VLKNEKNCRIMISIFSVVLLTFADHRCFIDIRQDCIKETKKMEIKNIEAEKSFHEAKFTRKNLFQKGKSTAFLLNLLPGQSVPPHPHPNARVYLLVVEGEGTCTIDGKSSPISQNDLIYCADEEVLGLENTGGSPLTVYVVMAKE
jgi:mannose-6-phosphate isomerase-like protein (cupin superfamily)